MYRHIDYLFVNKSTTTI